VTYSIAYDRSALIQRAVQTLEHKLLEESLVVALVCLLFLLHFRSALVAILILPIAVLIAFVGHVRCRASAPTSCRWAASPSPSAPWSTRSSS
jgi:Cu/Ag efflux pump CusA